MLKAAPGMAVAEVEVEAEAAPGATKLEADPVSAG